MSNRLLSVRAHGLWAVLLLLVTAGCALPTGTGPDDSAEVSSASEGLSLRRVPTSLSITATGPHSITLAYPCEVEPREIWRRVEDGTFQKIGDIPRCSLTGTFVDEDAELMRRHCYRLRQGRSWDGPVVCGRTRYVRCGQEGRRWINLSCPSDNCVFRVPPNSCLDVRGTVKLDPSSSYEGVEVRIRNSNTTLDCQGATLASSYAAGTGVTVTSPWTATVDRDELVSCAEAPPEGLCQYSRAGGAWQDTVDPLRSVRVENCIVIGYEHGAVIELQGAWSEATTALISAEYEKWFRHPTEQQCRVGQIENCLRDAAPRDVTFDGVDIIQSDGNGLHVRSYVHGMTFQNGSVYDTGAVGVYFSSGTRDNVIRNSDFRENEREAIALDSSAFNLISGNTLVHNSDPDHIWPEWEQPFGQGITVFRNAWENRPASGPRLQHAEGNIIENNTIVDHEEAIWIGFRQSTGRHSATERNDPVYFSEDSSIPWEILRYYRKNAEDTVVRGNTIWNFNTGVVVEDDRASIVGNRFLVSGNLGHDRGIIVGSRSRREAMEPVYGATVIDNEFIGDIGTPILVRHCAYGTSVRDNWWAPDGAWSRVHAESQSCTGSQASLVGHITGPDGEIPDVSFGQSGGFFEDGMPWLAGDVDDDGLTDVVSVVEGIDSRTRIWLHASAGDGLEHKSSFQTFEPARVSLQLETWPYTIAVPVPITDGQWLLGDFDGERGEDLAFLYTDDGLDGYDHLPGADETRVRVWRAEGRGFLDPTDHRLLPFPAIEGFRWLAGDVTGDGRADLVSVQDDRGSALVGLHRSLGSGRFDESPASQYLGAFVDQHRFLLGDVTGDDRADFVRVFEGSNGRAMAWVHRSAGGEFTHAWLDWISTTGSSDGAIDFETSQQWHLADVSGDGRRDIVAVRPIPGITIVFEARAVDGGLAYHGTTLIPRELGDAIWLAGRFDCGAREDFVTVRRDAGWRRPRAVTAPPGPACSPIFSLPDVTTGTATP